MKSDTQPKENPWLTIWIVTRFVLFGVGGFWVIWIGCWLLGPVYGFPVVFIGGLMMLFGSGMWGRWAYLWVFFSTPLAIMMMIAVDLYLPRWERYVPLNKGSLILLLILLMPLSYWGVRRYYKRREAALPSNAPTQQLTHNHGVNQ